MNKPLGACLVGYGYWSPKLIRNIRTLPEFKLIAVCEKDASRHQHIRVEQPDIEIIQHYKETFARTDIDVVIIATIPSSHYRIAKAALEAGKHVLVEKPLTLSTKEGKTLQDIAKEKKLILMVDHTYLYTPPILALKDIVKSGKLGSLFTVESTRINLGLFQRDSNVIWDLAPHDFSVLLFLLDDKPKSVQAVGVKTVSHSAQSAKQESNAHILLKYQSGMTTHVHVSWNSPLKVRQLMLIGSEQIALYDQLASDQLVVFNQAVYPNDTEGESGPLFNYKIGETTKVPYETSGEDLSRMLSDFANSVLTGNKPRANSELALDVVAILSAAQKSVEKGGREVDIVYEDSIWSSFLNSFKFSI